MPGQVNKYLNRISGPLMDRIDMQVEILPVPFEELSQASTGETSEQIRQRVMAAREIQNKRFAADKDVYCNAQMGPKQLAVHSALSDECKQILNDAMTRLDMSARAYDRILRVARTIADLDASATIEPNHIREAISYRNLDRSSWGNTLTKSSQ